MPIKIEELLLGNPERRRRRKEKTMIPVRVEYGSVFTHVKLQSPFVLVKDFRRHVVSVDAVRGSYHQGGGCSHESCNSLDRIWKEETFTANVFARQETKECGLE